MSVHKEIYGNADDQCQVTDWDQNMKFSGLTGLSTYNVGSSNVIDRLPSLSPFESGSLSEIMTSFALPENTQMQEFPSSDDLPVEKNLKGKKRKKSFECGDQSVEVEKQNDVPTEIDEKKQKNGVVATMKGNGDAHKEDFVHIRAKRGQATNSHSLAERVRRERISERMKLLQDLVPGCNKITGKAVMLDEIINYVQSLQKQVEFLSMKLATVNPEFNLDIRQLFLKENGSSPSLGYTHPQLQPEMVIPSIQNSRDFLRMASNSQFSTMAQGSNSWDDEFQNAVQMGLIPNLPSDGMELNGCMKMEPYIPL